MIQRQSSVLDQLGRPVPGADVYVYDSVTDTAAVLTSDGVTPLVQPVKTDAFGVYSYYADTGVYLEEIRYGGHLRYREAGIALGSPSPPTAESATRAALAGVAGAAAGNVRRLTEAGREGVFQFDSSDLSAKVAADPNQGLYVAPAAAPTGANGAWVRKFEGRANGLWWGVVPGVGDTSAAVIAAKVALQAFALGGYGYSSGVPRLYLPGGPLRYFMGATLELTHTIIIEGDTSGPFGGASTILEFALGVTGIRSQRWNTSGAAIGGVAQAYPGGDGSTLRNLYIRGAYAGAEAEAHGVQMRSAISFENVTIENFQGDGVYANNSLTSGGATEGSASEAHANGLYLRGNRRGMYLAGADTNAGNYHGVHGIGNRQATIVDDSQLGNSFYGPSSHAAGLVAGSPCTLVHNLGNLFTPKRSTAGHASNSPPATGIDDARWWFVRAGVVDAPNNILQWTNGMSVREGGPFLTGVSNNVTFVSPYAEFNQSFSQFSNQTLYLNFNNNSGIRGGARLDAVLGQLRTNQLKVVDGGVNVLEASSGAVFIQNGLLYVDAAVSWSIQGRSLSGAQPDWQVYYGGAWANYYTPSYEQGHRFQHQTGGDIVTMIPGGVDLQAGKVLSLAGTTVIDNARNILPVAVTATAGITSSGGGIGYAAGAGGTVVQATSKATTVVLNKLSGEITLNGAALAGDTTVSFTLTDSQIGAGDTLTLNHVSGGTFGSYSLNARCAAGSATIDVRNVTPGALSEAIVIRFGVRKGSNT